MAEKKMPFVRRHESLRVPQGWTEQDKGLVIQLERIFDDIYKRFGRLGMKDLDAEVQSKLSPVSKESDGLAPQLPDEESTTKYLRQDGSWSVPPDTKFNYQVANNLTTTGEGYVLDARQGKTLSDELTYTLLGTYTTEDQIKSGLNTMLDNMSNYSTQNIRIIVSTATTNFRANHYYGWLARPGSASNGSVFLTNVSDVIAPVVGAKMASGWVFKLVYSQPSYTTLSYVSGVSSSGVSYVLKHERIGILSLYLNITSAKSAYTKLASVPAEYKPVFEHELLGIEYNTNKGYTLYLTSAGDLYCRNALPVMNPLIVNSTFLTAT